MITGLSFAIKFICISFVEEKKKKKIVFYLYLNSKSNLLKFNLLFKPSCIIEHTHAILERGTRAKSCLYLEASYFVFD